MSTTTTTEITTTTTPGAATPAIAVTAPVVEVTLLEDRARVVRRGRIALAAGQHRLRLDGVAPALADKSLTVQLTGAAARVAARVIDARCVRELAPWSAALSASPDEPGATAGPDGDADGSAAMTALLAEQRRLAEVLAALEAERGLAEREVEAVAAVAALAFAELTVDASWGRQPGDAGVQLDLLRQREAAARVRAVDAASRLDAPRRAAAHLEARLAERRASTMTQVSSIAVDLVVDAAGELELTASYLVPGACWRPYHEARLRGAVVDFATDACVWQATGEDWREVRLLCSTERASLGTEPPTLADDLLAAQRKSDALVVEVREQDIETTGLGGGRRAAAELPGIDDGGAALELRAPLPATVRSDGRPHRVRLAAFTAEASVSLIAMPELSPCVFLRSEQDNRGRGALLAGPVDLVRDSGLVGRTAILFVAAGERFALGWGPEAELRVSRTDDVEREGSGALSSWSEIRHAVDVRVSNLGGERRAITIQERVPVSEIDKVKIELGTGGSRGRTVDGDGRVSWSVVVEPFGQAAVELAYVVKKHDSVRGL